MPQLFIPRQNAVTNNRETYRFSFKDVEASPWRCPPSETLQVFLECICLPDSLPRCGVQAFHQSDKFLLRPVSELDVSHWEVGRPPVDDESSSLLCHSLISPVDSILL